MHTLFPIYGPFAIHSYGFMIALGLMLFIYLVQKDSRFKKLKLEEHFSSILMVGIAAALLGGRLLFYVTFPHQFPTLFSFFEFYKAGFSILGAVLAVLITVSAYLHYLKIPILPTLDLVAIYGALLQSISRIGCFLAGCCFGIPTDLPWGITYTDPNSAAPLYACLHPTQLYSSILLMLIFVFQYFIGRKQFKKTGMLTWSYLFLLAVERFVVDFWRGGRVLDAMQFSLNQYVALGIMALALIGFLTCRTSSAR